MEALAALVESSGVRDWQRFDQRDADVLDGYGFSLTATYECGELLASGYERYPENYDTTHAALAEHLAQLAAELPMVAE